jgi:hypothetical protein
MADFKSINVENLKIVDKDGKVRLRLFNTDHISQGKVTFKLPPE